MAVQYGGGIQVWLNQGVGTLFADAGQVSTIAQRDGLVLGDLDSDGDLDAYTAIFAQPDQVWLNDGSGSFTQSSFTGQTGSYQVDLGDLNGDGHLDAFVVDNGANQVWINNGSGISFTQRGTGLGSANSVICGPG